MPLIVSPRLRSSTPKEWVQVALSDFDAFLLDHAACERKASATGMSFVVKYPDRHLLLDPMIRFAREELEHFHQVYRLIASRGLMMAEDTEDIYVNRILKHVRTGREDRFLDRLIASSVIEARGCERLFLVADAVDEPELKSFYSRLARAEDHHQSLFLEMAGLYFPKDVILERLNAFLEAEANSIASVPFRPAMH